jgi:hypothetical protein
MDPTIVRTGMVVVDAAGRRLGKVTRCDQWAFEVRRGLWSPRDSVIRYDEVLGADGDTLRVARSDADLFELAAGGLPRSWAPVRPPEAGGELPATPAESRDAAGYPNPRSPLAGPEPAHG